MKLNIIESFRISNKKITCSTLSNNIPKLGDIESMLFFMQCHTLYSYVDAS